MLINISPPSQSPHPILNLGFRVFFVGAAVFSVLTMVLWHWVLLGKTPSNALPSPMYWHGHEMVFGYAVAVIAGFLLTAVKAWTSLAMPVGWRLLGIFVPWALARLGWAVMPFVEGVTATILIMTLSLLLDTVFLGLICAVIGSAVWRARQKRQAGVVAILIALLCCQLGFGISSLLGLEAITKICLYVALLLVIGMVLVIGRRVLPFFIEKGVGADSEGQPIGTQVALKNSIWLDRAVFVSFFWVALGLLTAMPLLISVSAVISACCQAWRLLNWHHKGIWAKPLLWSLYLAFWGMAMSLGLLAILPWTSYPVSLGVHSLALFGIGLTTLAMMARVSLGHTGRNIHKPPKTVAIIFLLMIACALIRAILPMAVEDYLRLMSWAQLCWIASFVIFLFSYFKMLIRPRVDGIAG